MINLPPDDCSGDVEIMMKEKTIPLSLLDLAPSTDGNTLSDAITNSVRLAQAAEKAGYHRFWMAEHHNMVDIASAATAGDSPCPSEPNSQATGPRRSRA